MCEPKILAFYSEQFSASGDARNFAEARIGLDDWDESLYYSQRSGDRCPGLNRDELDGLPWSEAGTGEPQSCQTTETVWLGIRAPPHAIVTAGWGAGTRTISIWAWTDTAHAENRTEQKFLAVFERGQNAFLLKLKISPGKYYSGQLIQFSKKGISAIHFRKLFTLVFYRRTWFNDLSFSLFHTASLSKLCSYTVNDKN